MHNSIIKKKWGNKNALKYYISGHKPNISLQGSYLSLILQIIRYQFFLYLSIVKIG